MCGRFTLTIEISELQRILNLGEFSAEFHPRYNISPSQPVPVVTDYKNKNIDIMRWGLIPPWAKDIHIGYSLINARSETIHQKPAFRNAFRNKRCLILADGFYEWKKEENTKKKQSFPYYFYLMDHKPFMFAGLWESWISPNNEKINSCSIITCDANEIVSPIHNRMPVILDDEHCWNWLELNNLEDLKTIMQPYQTEKMIVQPVSTLVNFPNNDYPGMIDPITK
jgi:putative SOS response-associated peptidase YedK